MIFVSLVLGILVAIFIPNEILCIYALISSISLYLLFNVNNLKDSLSRKLILIANPMLLVILALSSKEEKEDLLQCMLKQCSEITMITFIAFATPISISLIISGISVLF